MAIDTERPASRRNILAAAIGGLGGLLAGRLAQPDRAAAAQGDQVTVGGTFQGTSVTSFESTTNEPAAISLQGRHSGVGKGVAAIVDGAGTGLYAQATDFGGQAIFAASLDSAAVFAISQTTTPQHPGMENAGVIGIAGDATSLATDVSETGVYGFCDTSSSYAVGVWGDTVQGIGVAGTGDWGLFGSGNVALRAIGPIALYTTGKLVFAGRGGHARIAAGRYYLDVAISGMTSAADVIATLRTRKTGYFIAAVVSYNGFFRMFLNKTATTSMYFNFLVLN